jgi:RNA polymerase sigma-70 factor (ECF subfamily)
MTSTKTVPQIDVADLADAQLIELALKGNAAGFRQIMKRYNQRLYRTARGILGDDAEAEDAVQETYLSAFKHLRSFRGDAALSSWLTRIAINESLARRKKRRPTTSLDKIDAPDGARIIAFPGSQSVEDPEVETGRREMGLLLARLVDELPEAFRLVFVLREMEQMSVEETAAELKLKPETVKTRLHRARRILRASMEKELGSAIRDAYAFDGWRCDRLTERVLGQLEIEERIPESPDRE